MNPTIKPLAWIDIDDGGIPGIAAASTFGEIKITVDRYKFHTPFLLQVDGQVTHCFTLDCAKANAQNLHEQRIQSFLA